MLLRQELSAAVKVICADLDNCFGALYSGQPQQQPAAHQHSPSSSSTTSTSTAMLVALDYLYVVLSLVASPSFRPAVVDEQLIQSLSNYLLAATADDGLQQLSEQQEGCIANFRASLLQVLEALSQVRQSR